MPPVHPTDSQDDADAYTTIGSLTKRRKTRKGTHSCWACKRRKERCIFDPNTPTSPDQTAICLGCKRRRTPCVSQEFPDESSSQPDGLRQLGERLVKVEAVLERLTRNTPSKEEAPPIFPTNTPHYVGRYDHSTETPASNGSDFTQCSNSHRPFEAHQATIVSGVDTPQSATQYQSATVNETRFNDSGPHKPQYTERTSNCPAEKLTRLSRTLQEALPSPRDSDIIRKASHRCFYMFDEILTVSYNNINHTGVKSPESILICPGLDAHPVLVARHMLRLALVLQQCYPNLREELQDLSETPQKIVERLARTAIGLVTTQDRLLGNIEGVECVMLESMYHANYGSLRLSWAASRRAMYLAQLMGFHLPENRIRYQVLDSKSRADPRFMWFRIVYYDRYLCLMLGLPQGSNDRSMASDTFLTGDTPVGRLERIHCDLKSRILERNESDTKSHDFALTQELDRELQKAARIIPSKWWLLPNMGESGKDDKALFQDLKRLITQMSHYNILIQLHLRYMLRSPNEDNYEYSKIACVNASREILSRFVILRNFTQIAFCCRTLDFVALMAALTLLLAHLDSHRRSSPAGNLLAHQYFSDRAMMEQVQESMEEVSHLDPDVFGTQSADLLRRLLVIEAEAADGHTSRAEGVSVQGPGTTQSNEHEGGDGVVSVNIPYFGVIKIAREGTISKEAPRSSYPPAEPLGGHIPFPASGGSNLNSSPRPSSGPQTHLLQSSNVHQTKVLGPTSWDDAGNFTTLAQVQPQNIRYPNTTLYDGNFHQIESQYHNGLFDPFLPGLTAGADDWTFQGVDMAFFDSLIGNTSDGG